MSGPKTCQDKSGPETFPAHYHRDSFRGFFGQIGLTLRIMRAVEISVFRDFITNMEVILDDFKVEKLEI